MNPNQITTDIDKTALGFSVAENQSNPQISIKLLFNFKDTCHTWRKHKEQLQQNIARIAIAVSVQSSVTLDYQVTIVVMNSGSQLSEL